MCKTTPTTFCQKGSAPIQILQVSYNYHSLCLRISGQQRTLSVNAQRCCFAPHFGWNFATCHKPYLLLCIYPVATAGASRSQPLGDHPVPADQAGTFQTRQLSSPIPAFTSSALVFCVSVAPMAHLQAGGTNTDHRLIPTPRPQIHQSCHSICAWLALLHVFRQDILPPVWELTPELSSSLISSA